jgi:hypothetical protein
VGIVGNAYATRFGDSLKTRSDVDPIAENIVIVDDDVADVNADAKLDPELRSHFGLLLRHLSLDFHPATRRVDCAGELDQHAIAGGLDDAATVGSNPGIDKRLSKRL